MFCNLEERESKEIAPGIEIRTFWQEKMLVSIVDLAPHSVVPLHSHEHEQCGAVLSGELELTIGEETRLLKAGDSYMIAGHIPHAAYTSDQACRVMDVFSPVRDAYKY